MSTWRNYIAHGVRDKHWGRVHPVEACRCVSRVCDQHSLSGGHFHGVFLEVEFHCFLGKLKCHWVSWSSHKECERSIVDIVSDWCVKVLWLLRAEDNIEASFLTWGNTLRKWVTLLELRVLIKAYTNVDVLAKIIADVKASGGWTLNEDIFVVDLLRSSCNLLELFTSEVNLTVFSFLLCGRLSLEFLLNNSSRDLVLASTNADEVGVAWLVFANGLFNIERIDVFDNIKLWLHV